MKALRWGYSTGTCAGGFREKYEAAGEMSIPVVVWIRPSLTYPRIINSTEELREYILTRKGCL